MRNLFSDGSESLNAPPVPPASRSMALSTLIPTIQRLAQFSGRPSGGAGPGVISGGMNSMSNSSPSASVAPATHHLDRILNEPDDEDEDEDDRDADEDEAGGIRASLSDFRSRPESLVDYMHTHMMGGDALSRRPSGINRIYNPYTWAGPDALGGSPIATSSSSLSPTSGANARFGGLLTTRAPGPPEEIDLTVSSDSEDENEQEGAWLVSTQATRPTSATGVVALTDGEEARSGGEEEDVQIIGSTGESGAPFRRKRRRPASTAASATGDGLSTKRSRGGFDPNAAESTNVSLENNDAIEQFKRALKCSICLDEMTDMTSTMCGHVFCARCITAQVRINGKCPLCQRRLQLKDIHPLFF